MAKDRKIVVSFRIEEDLINELKALARRKSAKENRDISSSEMIREMIQNKIKRLKGSI